MYKQTQNTLVSIIIPVYNAKKHLRACLDSVISQTYTYLEIIIVNDGSTDGSQTLCEEYATADKRIKLIHKDNEGVSKARNMGLDIATGKYINFIDADDTVEPQMIESLLKSIQGSQIALCYYNDMKPNGTKILHQEPLPGKTHDYQSIREYLIPDLVGTASKTPQCALVMGSLCRCLFERKLIEQTPKIRLFNVKLAEDLLFLIEFLSRCQSASIVPVALYNYRENTNSATRSYMNNAYETVTSMLQKLEEILKFNNIFTDDVSARLRMTELYNITSCITNELKTPERKLDLKRLDKIRHIRNHPCFKNLTWKLIFKIKSNEKFYFTLIKLNLIRVIHFLFFRKCRLS